MRKLIISELKKMLKSKFHLSLLIFVIVMMVVQIVREDYRAVNAYEPDLQFSTFDGEPTAICMFMQIKFTHNTKAP